MKPCVTPSLQAEAAAAEKRRDDAIERLLSRTAGEPPSRDVFEGALRAPIDADRQAPATIGKGKP